MLMNTNSNLIRPGENIMKNIEREAKQTPGPINARIIEYYAIHFS